MRERRRRHDDVHFPMGGRGRRATPPKTSGPKFTRDGDQWVYGEWRITEWVNSIGGSRYLISAQGKPSAEAGSLSGAKDYVSTQVGHLVR